MTADTLLPFLYAYSQETGAGLYVGLSPNSPDRYSVPDAKFLGMVKLEHRLLTPKSTPAPSASESAPVKCCGIPMDNYVCCNDIAASDELVAQCASLIIQHQKITARQYSEGVVISGQLAAAQSIIELAKPAIEAPLLAEIETLRERLEIKYEYDGDGNKVPFEGDWPDGIVCRDATIKLLEEQIATLRERVKELEAGSVPEGMEHCHIRFKECPVGHGRLTADNWVDHGCQACVILELNKNYAALVQQTIKQGTKITTLTQQVERMREALQWYADCNHAKVKYVDGPGSSIKTVEFIDHGEHARQALAASGEDSRE